MRYNATWINNIFLGIVYKKGSFIPLGIKFCSPKRHPITLSIQPQNKDLNQFLCIPSSAIPSSA